MKHQQRSLRWLVSIALLACGACGDSPAGGAPGGASSVSAPVSSTKPPSASGTTASVTAGAASASASPSSAAAVAALPPDTAPVETPPAPGTPVSAGDLKIPAGPVVLQVGAAKVTYKTAILYSSGGAQVEGDKKIYGRVMSLVLSTSDKLDCEKHDYGKDYIQIELGPGPDGSFYAGKEIATTFFAYADAFKPIVDGNRVYVKAPFSRLKLDNFKLTDPSFDLGLGIAQTVTQKDKPVAVKGGGHVKVQICNAYNKDSFDAVAATRVAPAKARPVQGTVGGMPFQSKTALAIVEADKENGVDVVTSFAFFAGDATCEAATKDIFSGGGVQGIGWNVYDLPLTSKNRLTGVAIPLAIGGSEMKSEAGKFKSTSINFDSGRSGWIRIDEAKLEEGGTIKGAMVADSGPKISSRKSDEGRLDGTFVAKVCRKK